MSTAADSSHAAFSDIVDCRPRPPDQPSGSLQRLLPLLEQPSQADQLRAELQTLTAAGASADEAANILLVAELDKALDAGAQEDEADKADVALAQDWHGSPLIESWIFESHLIRLPGRSSIAGCTLLHAAVAIDNHLAVRVILDCWSDSVPAPLTAAGETPLHLACSLGNPFLVRLLALWQPAQLSARDCHGNTPGHCAAAIGVACVAQLCCLDGVNWNLHNQEDKTPAELADPAGGVQALIAQYQRPSSLFYKHRRLEIIECCRFVEHNETGLCCCGRDFDSHIYRPQPETDIFLGIPWRPETHTMPLGSNAFGLLKFSAFFSSRFARVSDTIDDSTLRWLLQSVWGLRLPSMLVTVLGGRVTRSDFNNVFMKGFWKAAGSNNSLVVTDGISEGIVRLTGKTVRDYNDAYGQSKINLLGVLPWQRVELQHWLVSQDFAGTVCHMELQDSVTTVLDSNHNFFLMVDTGPPAGPAVNAAVSAARALALSRFRSRVESLLCRWPLEQPLQQHVADGSLAPSAHQQQQQAGSSPVPTCAILVNGSRDDLASLHSCVVARRCSAVIVKSSGGLADLTCQLLDLLYGEGRVQKPGGQEAILQASIGPLFQHYFGPAGGGHPPPGEDEVQTLRQLLAARHLIEVFSVEDDMASDFDGKILASLLGMSYSDAEEAESSALNLDQLRIAVSLDRSDIAKERVFTDTKQWKQSDLEPLMFQVLLANQLSFAELLLDQGFSLNTYVTERVSLELYRSSLDESTGHNASMFKRLVRKRIEKPSQLTLQDVYQVMHSLAPNQFAHQLQLQQHQWDQKQKTKQQQPQQQHQLRGCLQAVIWCLLTGRYTMALRFCRQDQEVLSTGLLCALLLRRLAQATDSVQEREELGVHADRFEKLSVAVLSECSKEDTGKTCLVLVRPVPHLDGASAFEIGAEGQSLSFIAHGSCQTVLDLMWRGGLTKRLSDSQFYFISLIGFFLPFFVAPLLRLMLRRAPKKPTGERVGDSANFANEVQPDEEASASASSTSTTAATSTGAAAATSAALAAHRAPSVMASAGPDAVSVSVTYDGRDAAATGFEQSDANRLLNRSAAAQRSSCRRFVCDTYEFYSTPVVRFMYTSIAYAIFLALFTYVLLFAMGNSLTSWGAFHVILAVFVLSFLIEEAKQVLISGRSLAEYLSTGWNLMDIVAIATFLLAALLFGLRLVPGLADPVVIGPDSGSVNLLRTCRILLGVSLFLSFCRLLQNFSVHVNLGPKVVMIQTMIIQDLVPFMVIFLVFVLGYGIFAWSTLFPLTYPKVAEAFEAINSMLKLAYFQTFGELKTDFISGEADECKLNSTKCPDSWGRYIAPVLLGFYTVFTNVLLLNLLIAMFANTYERIQSSSLQYWTLQRYLITRDFTERSVAPPPLSIFWNLAILLYILCKGRRVAFETDPVMCKISGISRGGALARATDSQLVKWENLRAQELLRRQEEGGGGSGGTGASARPAARTAPGGSGGGGGGGGSAVLGIGDAGGGGGGAAGIDWDMLQGVVRVRIKEGLKETEKKLRQLDNLTEKCQSLEDRVEAVAAGLQTMGDRMESRHAASMQLLQAIASRVQGSSQIILPVSRPAPPAAQPPPEHWRAFSVADHRLLRSLPFDSVLAAIGRMSPLEQHQSAQANSERAWSDWREPQIGRGFVFNAFDPLHKVNKKSMVGSYQLNEGRPLHPVLDRGGSGSGGGVSTASSGGGGGSVPSAAGRGRLPLWGPNHVMVLMITRWRRDDRGTIVRRGNRKVLQCAVVAVRDGPEFLLPWYLVKHHDKCSLVSCGDEFAQAFLADCLTAEARAKPELRKKVERAASAVKLAAVKTIYVGVNTEDAELMHGENAWLETACVNVHENYSCPIGDELLTALTAAADFEQFSWEDVANRRMQNGAELALLRLAAEHHGALF